MPALTTTQEQAIDLLEQAATEMHVRGRITGEFESDKTGAVCAIGALDAAWRSFTPRVSFRANELACVALNRAAREEEEQFSAVVNYNDVLYGDPLDPDDNEAVELLYDQAISLIRRGKV